MRSAMHKRRIELELMKKKHENENKRERRAESTKLSSATGTESNTPTQQQGTYAEEERKGVCELAHTHNEIYNCRQNYHKKRNGGKTKSGTPNSSDE